MLESPRNNATIHRGSHCAWAWSAIADQRVATLAAYARPQRAPEAIGERQATTSHDDEDRLA